ncbi:unnamed protein product [Choristocarpus tenellus]
MLTLQGATSKVSALVTIQLAATVLAWYSPASLTRSTSWLASQSSSNVAWSQLRQQTSVGSRFHVVTVQSSPSIRWRATVAMSTSEDSETSDPGVPEIGDREVDEVTKEVPSVFKVRGLQKDRWRATPWSEGREDVEVMESKGVSDDQGVADTRSTWEKVQKALGLGFYSYAGLGLALIIIFLNQTLGLGWLAKLLGGDGGGVFVETQSPFQVVPLDDPSNLLP